MDLYRMILILALALMATIGTFYPFFASAIDCLGAFLTGSALIQIFYFESSKPMFLIKLGQNRVGLLLQIQ
jgi:hypothetical protein